MNIIVVLPAIPAELFRHMDIIQPRGHANGHVLVDTQNQEEFASQRPQYVALDNTSLVEHVFHVGWLQQMDTIQPQGHATGHVLVGTIRLVEFVSQPHLYVVLDSIFLEVRVIRVQINHQIHIILLQAHVIGHVIADIINLVLNVLQMQLVVESDNICQVAYVTTVVQNHQVLRIQPLEHVTGYVIVAIHNQDLLVQFNNLLGQSLVYGVAGILLRRMEGHTRRAAKEIQ